MTDVAVSSAINQYLMLDPSRRGELLPAFRAEIEAAVRDGQSAEALSALRRAVCIEADYSTLLSLHRLLNKVRASRGADP